MRATGSPNLAWSMRCYRLLLGLYPRQFRKEFAWQQCQVFEDILRHARQQGGSWGVARVWARALGDLLSSAVSERLPEDPERRFRWRWVLACSLGLLLGAFLLFPIPLIVFSAHWITGTHPAPTRAVDWVSSGQIYRVIVEISAIIAIGAGWTQSRVFETRTSRRLWMASTIFGLPCAWAVQYGVESSQILSASLVAYRPFVVPVSFLAGGAILGLFQMLAIVTRSSRAWAWVPSCAVSVLVANYAGLSLERVLRSFGPGGYLLLAVLGGAIFGFLTAFPLRWILRAEGSIAAVLSRDSGN